MNNQRLINQGLNTISKIIETDTDTTLTDIQLLTNLNTNQALNYIKLSEPLDNIITDTDSITRDLDSIALKIDKLESIVDELDLYSLELEKKLGVVGGSNHRNE